MRILVFGDSIAQGMFDTIQGGWVNRLMVDLMLRGLKDPKGEWFDVFNLGVSGDFSKDVLARIESETKARIWDNHPLAIVVAVGTNNTHLAHGQPASSPSDYKQELEQIMSKAKELSNHVLLVGMAPADEAMTSPVNWDDSTCFSNDRIWEFEQVQREVAQKTDLPFVPIFEDFKAKLDAGESLLADGLHPNDAGHEFIYRKVKPELDKLLQS